MTDSYNQEIAGKETDSTTTWILLQIADSAFPTGGFSHSFGFESATKHGFVTEYSAFKAFLFSCLQNTASFSLSFVNESHKNCHDVERIKELDGMVQAYLSNHVANRASIRQGNSLLDTACKTFGKQEMKNLQAQSLQFEMQKTAEEIRKKFEMTTVEEATTTAPVADFLQGAHDNLFSKLFYS
ncbi:hypothetical protein pdam_00010470 [Pocillopora damicornis]|uniref:Urease accessory protein UreF n=1 Tax=Pocillopora damicornis TaxID=46731 RepID=A0A3M6V1K6_POCDA|nr:hypothetical protein pdam_00010470 [Pocillopora damicornis]